MMAMFIRFSIGVTILVRMIHIGEPKMDRRPKSIYMGIRTITPFKGMFKVIDTMSKRMSKISRLRLEMTRLVVSSFRGASRFLVISKER
jgi:hypothetical protein